MQSISHDSPTVSRNGFADSVYETLDSVWQNKESNDAGQLLLTSLVILTKDRNEFFVNQLLVSQHVLKANNKFNDKIVKLQMHRNSIKASKCAQKENHSNSHRTQIKDKEKPTL